LSRYTILVSAVVMQVCMGATYSWSVYVQPLRQMWVDKDIIMNDIIGEYFR
jgi:hypothetical protein